MGYKILSFSLWGGKPIYTEGALRNAEIAQDLFPDWKCRFHTNSVPEDILNELAHFPNVELAEMDDKPWKKYGRRAGGAQPENSIFWKFLPYYDPHVDVILGRDPDQRPSKREKIAVDEFLASDKQFHIIRDHPGHCTGTPILGAMWGIKRSIGLDMAKLTDEHMKSEWPMIDQWFLMKSIYPLVKNQAMIHHDESCANGCQIPKDDPLYWVDGPNSEHRMLSPRESVQDIIGLDIDENDKPNMENVGKLDKWIKTGVYWWKK
jgi:hypothetical protein